MRRLFTLAAAGLAACAPNAFSQASSSEFTSRYTTLGECPLFAEGEPGYDWIVFRCEGYGGMPIWWRYSDSARLYIGFGERQHDSGFFGFDRDPDWPIEWRGRISGDQFIPHAVIIRMPRPIYGSYGEPESSLMVFRLRDDGTSCLLEGDILANERAREVADASAGEFDCPNEPYLYDDGLIETASTP